jgi:hypothetical protein
MVDFSTLATRQQRDKERFLLKLAEHLTLSVIPTPELHVDGELHGPDGIVGVVGFVKFYEAVMPCGVQINNKDILRFKKVGPMSFFLLHHFDSDKVYLLNANTAHKGKLDKSRGTRTVATELLLTLDYDRN